MNPGLVVKLRPAGPWRIGPDSGARNRVDVIYHSDSLYSAVTSAMARMGRLEDWLGATARSGASAVCFSSCFPFLDEIGFVMPPRTVWPPSSPSRVSARVRWKSARFVPLGIVQAILAGQPLDDEQWSVDGPSECLVPAGRMGPFRTSVRWAAAVDRLSGSSERHSTACIEFRPGAGLWTVVSFADEAARAAWSDPVKAAFRWLADSGFGGERSRGWGRAETPEFVEGTLPEMILPAVGQASGLSSEGEAERPAQQAMQAAPSPILPLKAPASGAMAGPRSESAPAAPASEEPSFASSSEPATVAPDSDAASAAPASEEPSFASSSEPAPVTADSDVPATAPAPEEPSFASSSEAAPVAPDADAAPAAPAPEEPSFASSSEAAPVAPDADAAPAAPTPEEPSFASSSEPAPVAPDADAAPDAASSESATFASTSEPASVASDPDAATGSEAPPSAADSEAGPDSVRSEAPSASTSEAAVAAFESEGAPPPDDATHTPIPAVEEPPPEPRPPAPSPEPTAVPPGQPGGLSHAARTKGLSYWLLSLYTPATDDAVDWARGNYTVLVRGGRVESPAGSGDLKKQIQMVSEGSVVYASAAPRGAAADVAPDGFAHPVFRAGFAVSIPLPEAS